MQEARFTVLSDDQNFVSVRSLLKQAHDLALALYAVPLSVDFKGCAGIRNRTIQSDINIMVGWMGVYQKVRWAGCSIYPSYLLNSKFSDTVKS